MAPLNSTLIDGYCGGDTSMAIELNRLSPILPRNTKKSISSSTTFDTKHPSENGADFEEIPIWISGEPRYVSGVIEETTCKELIEALISDEIRNGKMWNDGGKASRDVSDYVITERWRDVEQVHEANTCILPIWKAWSSAQPEMKFCLRLNKHKNIAKPTEKTATLPKNSEKQIGKDDEHCILSTKSDKKHKRLNIISRMMRRILRQGETIQDHLSTMNRRESKRRSSSMGKQKHGKKILLESFLNDAAGLVYSNSDALSAKGSKTLAISKNPRVEEPKMLEPTNVTDTEDELLLIIDNNDDLDSGVHMDKKQNCFNYCGRNTSKRKHRSRIENDLLKHHNLTKRILWTLGHGGPESSSSHSHSPSEMIAPVHFEKSNHCRTYSTKKDIRFDVVRFEIITKMDDMDKLLKREEELIAQLASKCAKYKAENKMYTEKIGLEMRIDEIQSNLERYAQEIVQNEIDLFRIKLEINQKNDVVENIKKLLNIVETKDDQRTEIEHLKTRQERQFQRVRQEMATIDFADNIYEFCDNNKSMIV